MALPTIPSITPSQTLGERSHSLKKNVWPRDLKDSGKRLHVLPTISSVAGSHPVDPGAGLSMRHSVKSLCVWFRTWRTWQRRVCVCRVMEHCTRQHLELLATSLEPVLHLDFSSTLLPHLASLHLDSVATFQVQRGIMERMVRSEMEGEGEASLPPLESLPTTLLTDTGSSESKAIPVRTSRTDTLQMSMDKSRTGLCLSKADRTLVLPTLPLTHPDHATAQLSSHRSSLEDAITIRRKRFSSVPDFKSTTDLLRHVQHKSSLRKAKWEGSRRHARSRSVGMVSLGPGWSQGVRQSRGAEHFKSQLGLVSEV